MPIKTCRSFLTFPWVKTRCIWISHHNHCMLCSKLLQQAWARVNTSISASRLWINLITKSQKRPTTFQWKASQSIKEYYTTEVTKNVKRRIIKQSRDSLQGKLVFSIIFQLLISISKNTAAFLEVWGSMKQLTLLI